MALTPLLEQWQREQIRHQVAIAGILSDALTQQPIAAAEIRLIQAPQNLRDHLSIKALQFNHQRQTEPGSGDRLWAAPDGSLALVLAEGQYTLQTWTAADGAFKFLDLPKGDYSLQASLPSAGTRYGTVTSNSLTVTRNQSGKLTPAWVDLQLPPTAMTGKVTWPAPVDPVPMAKVQILETGDYTYSSQDGDYLLTRLEASKTKEWAIAVTAPGYELDAAESLIKVKLLQGQVHTQNFSLKRKGVPSNGRPQ